MNGLLFVYSEIKISRGNKRINSEVKTMHERIKSHAHSEAVFRTNGGQLSAYHPMGKGRGTERCDLRPIGSGVADSRKVGGVLQEA